MVQQMNNLAELMKGADVVRVNSSNPADIIRAITGQQSLREPPKLVGHHPPSISDINSLDTCSIAQLEEGRHHTGEVIYLRVISQRIELGTVFTTQDHTGANVDVWSLILRPLGVDTLAQSTIIAIREPYYGCDPRGKISICLHHPTDCVYVSRSLQVTKKLYPGYYLPDDVDLVKAGDTAMITGDLLEALDLYSRQLDKLVGDDNMKESNVVRLKRAFCHSRLGSHASTLNDCLAIAASEAAPRQALKLAYTSALARDLPGQALDFAKALVSLDPDSAEYNHLVTRAALRWQQASRGFQPGSTVSDGSRHDAFLDMSSFIGRIEARTSSLGGRGLFATQDVNVGELLLCEKVTAVCEQNKISTFPSGLRDVLPGETSSSSSMALLQTVAQNSMLDPSAESSNKLLLLHAGKSFPDLDPHTGSSRAFDTYRAMSIIKHNYHSILPGSTSIHHDRGDVANKVLQDNSLPSSKDYYPGLWLNGSMFNHSCVPNCSWSWIGDMFIARSNRRIEKGEELTLAYIPGSTDHEKRQNSLEKQYGFRCNCALCRADATITEQDQIARAKMSDLLKKRLPNVVRLLNGKVSTAAINNLEGHVKNVVQSYPSPAYANLPNVQLADTFVQLANVHLGDIDNWRSANDTTKCKAYDYFLSALELGLNIRLLVSPGSPYCELYFPQNALPRAVGIFSLMGMAELKYHRHEVIACRALKACAKQLYEILYGERDTFGDHHPSYYCRGEPAEKVKVPEGWEEQRQELILKKRAGNPDDLILWI